MKKVDLYLEKPINIIGARGTSYPNVIHIDTMHEGDEYVEDVNGEILYLHEVDAVMQANVINIIDQNPVPDKKKEQRMSLMQDGKNIDWATAVLC
jgi:hypothetical protein